MKLFKNPAVPAAPAAAPANPALSHASALASPPIRPKRKPEPTGLIERAMLDLPTPTERSFEEVAADAARRRQRLNDLASVAALGPLSECCGVNPDRIGRDEMARRALCFRLLSLGRMPSIIALETGFSFAEVIAWKRKWNL